MDQAAKLKKYLGKVSPKALELDGNELLAAAADSLSIPLRAITSDDTARISGLMGHPDLAQLTGSKWEQHCCLPWDLQEKRIEIITADPFSVELRKEIAYLSQRQVSISLASQEEIQNFLSHWNKQQNSATLQFLIHDKPSNPIISISPIDLHQELSVKPDDVSAPLVIRIVDQIFSDALDRDTSDIHLTPTAHGIDVRLRVDGMLQTLMQVPLHLKPPVTARIKLLCGMDISERRKPQDGRLRLKALSGPVDLRLATIPSVHGENIVIRVLSNRSATVKLDNLGLSEDLMIRFTRVLRQSSKVVLISGPTGSGKTSTLYAGITYLADGERNIITIEDPVEYRIDGITQVQVNNKSGVTFASGLRSALRQDPDIIMIGEIRDLETATTAMQAAQTGHLVLSTVHTNSAEAAVIRFLDFGVQPYIIANSVAAVLAQRLVRKRCECSAETTSLVGCSLCVGTGYHGRVGIFSFLEITPDIAELIRINAGEQKIVEVAKQNGFQTLWENAEAKIALGVTDEVEVERVLGPKPKVQSMPLRTLRRGDDSEPSAEANTGKRKLLLVEDDDATRSILTMLFESEYFEVIEAINGIEGLDKAHLHRPNIIVSDLMMPKMGGLEMLKKLRSDKRINGTPVLLLTAASTEENELKVLEQGADDFVGKNVDAKIMIARVERLLARG